LFFPVISFSMSKTKTCLIITYQWIIHQTITHHSIICHSITHHSITPTKPSCTVSSANYPYPNFQPKNLWFAGALHHSHGHIQAQPVTCFQSHNSLCRPSWSCRYTVTCAPWLCSIGYPCYMVTYLRGYHMVTILFIMHHIQYNISQGTIFFGIFRISEATWHTNKFIVKIVNIFMTYPYCPTK